jgi:hypothetical protein
LRAEDFRALPPRLALDFLAADLRLDAALRDPDERLPADFLALLPRALVPRELRELLDAEPRDDLRAEDLRPPERLPLFFAPLEPPRDDFLAAAISELRYRGSRRRIATFAHKFQQALTDVIERDKKSLRPITSCRYFVFHRAGESRGPLPGDAFVATQSSLDKVAPSPARQ